MSAILPELPQGYWDFIIEYLPNYDWRDDVLESDIFTRYLDGEEVWPEDVECYFKGRTIEEIEEEHLKGDWKLLLEALENFIAERYGGKLEV